MKRLSWQWVNRLIVALALILPFVFCVGGWLLNIKGANLPIFQPSTSSYDDISIYMANFWQSNFLYGLAKNAVDGDAVGFQPIGDFVSWLIVNVLGIDETVTDGYVVLTLCGYLIYAFYVLLFDVLINGVTFFFRFIKKLMYMFEKED